MITLSSIWQYVDSVIHTPKPNGERKEFVSSPYCEPEWLSKMEKEKNLLFLYGGSRLVPESTAYTTEKFSLWNHNASGTAIAVAGAFRCEMRKNSRGDAEAQERHELQGIPREKIKGELFVVKENAFDDLDAEMMNGVFFERRRVSVRIPLLNCEGDPARLNAWMYASTPYIRRNIIWDASYYASTGGNVYSLEPLQENRKERWIGNYYSHTPSISNGKELKCNLYIHRGLDDPPAPAPKPQPAVIIQTSSAIIK